MLTAASGGKSAYEGYKGHGVFTYALMEALHQGDTNNNGKIEVSELAAHVEKRVPELFAELKQNGWVVKGAAAAAARGSGGRQAVRAFRLDGRGFRHRGAAAVGRPPRGEGFAIAKGHYPSPCPSPNGRGDALTTVASEPPLPLGEGWGEG